MESSDVELDLQRSVQAVLRELSTQAPALQSNQGMWRWSLHKKVERDPGKSPVLVRILLRELEKVSSWTSGRKTGMKGREGPIGQGLSPGSAISHKLWLPA
ncbi:phosphoinositide-3-kinase regulatory subunit 6 [Homo sapiens]|uniref:Phosphoinositide-3-kinase regulatory subunit 6 n=1 Tax=Homo sapiens TaxID=9606 RepID=A0A087X1F3_HUMAN|nr:phosphoinositide-3-kinase regulatory subunit 6 [Homo sapiens]KAI2581360.1 phosphoinositide-3-kinase regulatory subunit 6 [Homo sapiens]KAI4047870.1 phosphoinositide-3-kinase regulatory subunit 6 [Homo sapiens]KAI4047871.1 phosphoinositide-3-kinase regulatory subunit 6 [Homo sapiens]